MKTWLLRVAQMLAGLGIGLVLAELAFWWRDDGAFPHVNFYVPDEALAVRLSPDAHMRFKLSGTGTTEIHTNSNGFRGTEWKTPGPADVLVVGDSQVFGLGVGDDETFSARLGQELGQQVINAGVPTYGPIEYLAVVERLIEERRPRRVILTFNLANDLFELERPNLTRHALWDGWAVRRETAPTQVTPFPFRAWLMSRSHLVFALREWLSRDVRPIEATVSEGSWQDIVKVAQQQPPPKSSSDLQRERLTGLLDLDERLVAVGRSLDEHLWTQMGTQEQYAQRALAEGFAQEVTRRSYGEGSRPVPTTARELSAAATALAAKSPKLRALAHKMQDKELEKLLDEREALRAQRDGSLQAPAAHQVTPLDTFLDRARALCDRHHAELTLLVLPLDVMVNEREWEKYGPVTPIDMEPTRVLVDELAARAQDAKVDFVDATAALADAEPGAFLFGDLHLTAKGHAAVARALKDHFTAGTPVGSRLDLPEGRSWPPTRDEWAAAEEITVKGSTAARCETKQIREWFHMTCSGDPAPEVIPLGQSPTVMTELGGHGEAASLDRDEVLLPFMEGDEARVGLWGPGELHRVLVMSWPKGGARRLEIVPRRSVPEPRPRIDGPEVSNPLRQLTCEKTQTRAGALRRCVTPCHAEVDCPPDQACYPWPGGSFCGAK